jgi:myo-inositol catabolism protein IolS
MYIEQTYGSSLGFGTWQFGGALNLQGKPIGWGNYDETEAIKTIHAALDNGVRFFDTSDAYGMGRAELILGKAFALKPQALPIICTKFGNKIENDTFIRDYSEEWLQKAVIASLKRLQVSHIHILLLHSPNSDFNWADYDLSPFEALVKKGLIGAFGVSTRKATDMKAVTTANWGNVIEQTYNLIDRRAADYFHPEYSFIARVPLVSGLLTASMQTSFKGDDYRSQMSTLDREWIAEAVSKLSFLDELPGGIAISALRFCLFAAGVSVVIPGIKNQKHLDGLLFAHSLGTLAPEVIQQIYEVIPTVPQRWL